MSRASLPESSALSEPFWEAARSHRLVVQQCGSCGSLRHYPQELCPHCHSASSKWTALRGLGVIHSYTTTHQAFHPDWSDRVPYVVATVQLDEGIRMVSDLDEPPEAVTIGAAVEVFFERVDDQITLPRFRLLDRGQKDGATD